MHDPTSPAVNLFTNVWVREVSTMNMSAWALERTVEHHSALLELLVFRESYSLKVELRYSRLEKGRPAADI